MSKRAIVLGLLLAGAIGFLGFFNDMVMHQTFLFSNYMPIFVYGSLLLFVIVMNPLLRKIWKQAAFTGSEVALIVAIALPACYVSGRTLIHHFSECLIRPVLNEKVQPGWQKREFLRRTPSRMLVGVEPEYRPEDMLDPEKVSDYLFTHPHEEGVISTIRATIHKDVKTSDPVALCNILNSVVHGEQLLENEALDKMLLPPKQQHIAKTGHWNDEELHQLNRAILDLSLPKGSVRTRQELLDRALNGFQTGLSQTGDTHLELSEIPWYAWSRPLATFWLPLLISAIVAFIALALVVKRQWAEHEHLPFPIAKFAESLLPDEDGGMSAIFRKKGFWITMGVVAFIHLNNYGQAFWPEYMVRIPNFIDFTGFQDKVPVLARGGGAGLLRPSFYFALIGFAFFVSSNVSLSIGIAPFVYAIIAGMLVNYDVNLNGGGDYNSLRLNNFVKSGSYFGLFVMILYTGRHFYASVAKQALGFKSNQEVKVYERWGFRIFLIAALVFAIQLMAVGYDWKWALFQTFVFCTTFFVVSRVVAETGVILIHPMIVTGVLLWGFVGTRVLGGDQLLMLMLVGIVIEFGCHVGVMPMMLHSLKLSDKKPGRTAVLAGAGVVMALLIAVVTALYFQYDRGTSTVGDNWGSRLGRKVFAPIVQIENDLEAKGNLAEAGTYSGLDWFLNLAPNKGAVAVFIITALLVVGCEVMRLRINKWPFHPVMFLLSGFWHAQMMAASFLFGWLLKVGVHKYGGSRTYNDLKPVMIGLIAGDMLGGIIITLIGFIYYLVQNEAPIRFIIVPG